MKTKKMKIVLAVIAFAIIISIILSSTITLVNSNGVVTSFDKAYTTVGDMSSGLAPKSYVDTSVDYSDFSATEVLKAAAKYLGIAYASSDIKASDGRTTGMFRCGELVSYAIYDAGYMDDISGMYKITDYGDSANLYDPLYNWGCYEENGQAHTFGELCYEAYNSNTGATYIQYDGTTTYNSSASVTQKFAGKIGNKPISVLKVNEEANDNYPYYMYTKEDGSKAELPAGCVIYQFGCHFVKGPNATLHDHLFLTLGNLGTSDADTAGNILVQKGIITEEQKQYVTSKGSSNYWRIENNGAEGCVINNADVSLEVIENGNRKGCDAVWAFQLFDDKEIVKTGAFDIELVKYEKGTTKPLAGAQFKVDIPALNYTDTKTTGADGKATFKKADIDAEGKTYAVTVTELDPPDGYIGIDDTITFNVTSKLNNAGDGYELVPASEQKYGNAAKVTVEPGQIKITEENRTTSIDIHKGVKTVENQDSGYYAVDKVIEYALAKQAEEDASTEPTYEDATTGKEYSEVELEELQHEWVVETTIPEGIENYLRYNVTDPVDTTKLDFSGLDRVKVELIDSTGKVTKTLVKDTDYQAKYENDVLTITYIDKKDGNDFYGEFLSEATTSNKIRLTFNTTFKVNPGTGKLVVLEGTITNADNKAKLTYDNGNGEDKEKDSENPEVHTGAVSIFKYEDTNGNKKHDEGEKALVGAEFKIALSEEDAKNGKFIKIGGEELVATSNEHGLATFVGLSFGGDAKDDEENLKNGLYSYDWETASRDYYIVETKTPAGYEKVTDVLKVTVSKDSSEIIDLTDKINEMESVGNRPLKFDLALRKWVTHAFVTEKGQTVEYKTGHKAEDDPEAVVKVDLKKSKLNNVTVKFKYSIRITNEGEIAGEAREITDYIPAGLKFVQEDNPDWTTTNDERIVKTRKLEGVTLQPGESAEVEIMLTWVNSKDSMGVMTNTAEISEDYNEFGVHDIDSTPNNKKAGEDDIDDAPVMLAIKTGSEVIAYTSLGLGFVTVVTMGAIAIRRKFVNI